MEQCPGEAPRVHGPFRLVKFARFLLSEYFPLHDDLCFEEGLLMRALYLCDEKAWKALTALQGRTRALLDRCYAAD